MNLIHYREYKADLNLSQYVFIIFVELISSLWFNKGMTTYRSNFCSKIGARIKSKREELSLSQAELAKRIGYTSPTSIAKIEAGKVDLPQSKIIAFAEALDTTPAYLMGWEEDDPVRQDPDPIDTYDDELVEELQRLHDDPELRMLLSATKNLTKEDVRFMADLARRMHANENRDD